MNKFKPKTMGAYYFDAFNRTPLGKIEKGNVFIRSQKSLNTLSKGNIFAEGLDPFTTYICTDKMKLQKLRRTLTKEHDRGVKKRLEKL